jgi:hypothetical protein
MLIRVSINSTDPLTGTAATKGRQPLAFHGWLELLSVISDLITPTDSPAGKVREERQEPSTRTQREALGGPDPPYETHDE